MLGLHEGVGVYLHSPLICRSITCKQCCFICLGGGGGSQNIWGSPHFFVQWMNFSQVLGEKRSPINNHAGFVSIQREFQAICFTLMHVPSLNQWDPKGKCKISIHTRRWHSSCSICEIESTTSSCPLLLYQVFKEVWATPLWDILSFAKKINAFYCEKLNNLKFSREIDNDSVTIFLTTLYNAWAWFTWTGI